MKNILNLSKLAVLAALLVFSACKKDDATPASASRCYPSAIYIQGIKLTGISYNGSNMIIRMDGYDKSGKFVNNHISLTYNGSNVTKMETFDSANTLQAVMNYTYDNSNHIAFAVYTINGTINAKNVYAYDASGNLIADTAYYTGFTSTKLEVNGYHSYSYSGGNATVDKYYTYNTSGNKFDLSSTSTSEFDSHPNPFKGMVFFEYGISFFNSNNETKQTTLNAGSSTPTITTNTFEYNSNGYPTKSTDEKGEVSTVDYNCK